MGERERKESIPRLTTCSMAYDQLSSPSRFHGQGSRICHTMIWVSDRNAEAVSSCRAARQTAWNEQSWRRSSPQEESRTDRRTGRQKVRQTNTQREARKKKGRGDWRCYIVRSPLFRVCLTLAASFCFSKSRKAASHSSLTLSLRVSSRHARKHHRLSPSERC